MRLPHTLTESIFFALGSSEELRAALGGLVQSHEVEEIERLVHLGLPPVVSREALSVMLGVNPGLIWSFVHRPERHYRHFTIPKGRGVRHIVAPRVALKVIQKWISVHLQRRFNPPDHVYGFVPKRSHLDAAAAHVGARWVFSIDIENFFPTTPRHLVVSALEAIGYTAASSGLLATLFCYRGNLAQGSPASPVLSNIAFRDVDKALKKLSTQHGVRLSRYADDIVFSGVGDVPATLGQDAEAIIADSPWRLSQEKRELHRLPDRLKVHGLLVHGASIRLTKGYRNRLRAFRHRLETETARPEDVRRLKGHVQYQEQVKRYQLGQSAT